MFNKHLIPVIAIIALVSLFSCSKNDNQVDPPNNTDTTTNEPVSRADSFATTVEGKKFALNSYYSDSAIDYIDTDSVVKAETDLWAYVSSWLKDDHFTFNADGELVIAQNTTKLASDSSDVLTKTYSITSVGDDVKVTFVDNQYQPLEYTLHSFGDTEMILKAEWDGKTVFSKYTVVE